MSYFISLLAFLIFSTAHASCLEENVIKNQFLVVTSKDLSTSFSTKTKSRSKTGFLTYKKISSSRKAAKESSISLKAHSLKKTSTYLIESSSLKAIQKTFPNAQIQENCKIQFMQTLPVNADTLFSYQNWYFDSLNQNYSNSLTPLRSIVVAVSDTGVDTDHIDLQGNLWTNQSELNGLPNVDDDGNGYIDDVYGYDFGDNDPNPQPSFQDLSDYDHGTHVAGLIAARSFNSEGISGVSLNTVKIMSLKGFKSRGASTISDLLETIYYAVDNGADVINASWGTEKLPEAAEIAAVNYALQNGVVIVAAAGNSRVPASWFVPAGIKNVVTVASVNSSDQLSTFSNYGDSVDFISPGGDGAERSEEGLMSLRLGSNYFELQGTSMAAPLIAGLIGSLMSQSNSLTAFQAVYVLRESGKKISLRPYLQSNNKLSYIKPDFIRALDYLRKHKNIPSKRPPLEDISSYSRDLASTSEGGGGGCSNSLSSQPYENNQSINSEIPFFSIFLMLMPFLTVFGIKKGL